MGCGVSAVAGPHHLPISTAIADHQRVTAAKLQLLWSAQLPPQKLVQQVRKLMKHDKQCIPQPFRFWLYQHLSGGAALEAAFAHVTLPMHHVHAGTAAHTNNGAGGAGSRLDHTGSPQAHPHPHSHAHGLYAALLSIGPAEPVTDRTIRNDAHRTLPSFSFFGPKHRPGPGQSQLYRILTAYAMLDRTVAYTQGMNFFAALLLLAGLPEESAFYCFAGLMIGHGLRTLFAPGLSGCIAAQTAIQDALHARRPALAVHLFDTHGLVPAMFVPTWVLSGFVSSPLPPSSALVVLDWLLLEGGGVLGQHAVAGRSTKAGKAGKKGSDHAGWIMKGFPGCLASHVQATLDYGPLPVPVSVPAVVVVGGGGGGGLEAGAEGAAGGAGEVRGPMPELALPPCSPASVPRSVITACVALLSVNETAALACDETDRLYQLVKQGFGPGAEAWQSPLNTTNTKNSKDASTSGRLVNNSTPVPLPEAVTEALLSYSPWDLEVAAGLHDGSGLVHVAAPDEARAHGHGAAGSSDSAGSSRAEPAAKPRVEHDSAQLQRSGIRNNSGKTLLRGSARVSPTAGAAAEDGGGAAGGDGVLELNATREGFPLGSSAMSLLPDGTASVFPSAASARGVQVDMSEGSGQAGGAVHGGASSAAPSHHAEVGVAHSNGHSNALAGPASSNAAVHQTGPTRHTLSPSSAQQAKDAAVVAGATHAAQELGHEREGTHQSDETTDPASTTLHRPLSAGARMKLFHERPPSAPLVLSPHLKRGAARALQKAQQDKEREREREREKERQHVAARHNAGVHATPSPAATSCGADGNNDATDDVTEGSGHGALAAHAFAGAHGHGQADGCGVSAGADPGHSRAGRALHNPPFIAVAVEGSDDQQQREGASRRSSAHSSADSRDSSGASAGGGGGGAGEAPGGPDRRASASSLPFDIQAALHSSIVPEYALLPERDMAEFGAASLGSSGSSAGGSGGTGSSMHMGSMGSGIGGRPANTQYSSYAPVPVPQPSHSSRLLSTSVSVSGSVHTVSHEDGLGLYGQSAGTGAGAGTGQRVAATAEQRIGAGEGEAHDATAAAPVCVASTALRPHETFEGQLSPVPESSSSLSPADGRDGQLSPVDGGVHVLPACGLPTGTGTGTGTGTTLTRAAPESAAAAGKGGKAGQAGATAPHSLSSATAPIPLSAAPVARRLVPIDEPRRPATASVTVAGSNPMYRDAHGVTSVTADAASPANNVAAATRIRDGSGTLLHAPRKRWVYPAGEGQEVEVKVTVQLPCAGEAAEGEEAEEGANDGQVAGSSAGGAPTAQMESHAVTVRVWTCDGRVCPPWASPGVFHRLMRRAKAGKKGRVA